MPTASKFFAKAAAKMTCADLLHGQRSCCEAAMWNFTHTLGGCCRYVLPIAILPVILKLRRLKLSVLLESAAMFAEYSLASWLMVSGGLTMMCVTYRILGRFTYGTVLAVPVLFSSGLCSLFASQKLVEMFAHGLFTMAVEVSIARGDAVVLGFVRDSKRWRTLAFMLVNMALMRALQRSTGPNLWFLQPTRRRRSSSNAGDVNNNAAKLSLCCGKSATTKCADHIIQDVFQYMKLGIGVELLKAIIANSAQIIANPIVTIASLPRRIDCNLSAFLITYCGLYRSLNCWLTRHHPQRVQLVHLVASCASGIAFYLCPSTQLLAHAFATAVEMSWANYTRDRGRGTRCAAIDWLSRVPIARVFYPLAFAYLLQVRIFYPWLAPTVLKNLMNQTTNFKDDHIMSNYHERLFGGRSDPATLYLFGLDRLRPAQ